MMSPHLRAETVLRPLDTSIPTLISVIVEPPEKKISQSVYAVYFIAYSICLCDTNIVLGEPGGTAQSA
jgi:hypothetical protein